ncbi:hypothetical protein OGAPHI_002153 [Ogataea philodendri]|uniref:MOSC domain-containing protein n=1 Tax=Ogataea philodendri TaxID=1378263 RepID=A0A9P8PBV7_9ASCO|nr:uncharacterized protein OGAPHI_002153 [Ogataea philodendri]KAH3668399.1 hypothetical protein OGAPHI_002153 [Ogataea philodendri]
MISLILLYLGLSIVLINALTWTLKRFRLHETKFQHGLTVNLAPVRYLINLTYKINSKIPFVDKPSTTISEIRVHPIKSFPALKVQSWKVTEFGLDCDRMYMLSKWDKEHNKWLMVSLREYPSLSQVELRLEDDMFVVGFQNKDYFSVPRTVTDEYFKAMTSAPSTADLWKVEFEAFALDKLDLKPFLEAVGLPLDLQLVFAPFGKLVITNSPKNLTTRPGFVPGSHEQYRVTKFQDYFPVLLISQSDIDDLNQRLVKGFGPDFQTSSTHFRPNILIEGPKRPFDTDDWYRFTVNGREWIVASKCPRCVIPNIDFEKGKVHSKHPVSRTLAKFRRIDVGNPFQSYFGVNAVQIQHGYTISVGDKVQLLERRLNQYGDLS